MAHITRCSPCSLTHLLFWRGKKVKLQYALFLGIDRLAVPKLYTIRPVQSKTCLAKGQNTWSYLYNCEHSNSSTPGKVAVSTNKYFMWSHTRNTFKVVSHRICMYSILTKPEYRIIQLYRISLNFCWSLFCKVLMTLRRNLTDKVTSPSKVFIENQNSP